MLQIGTRNKFLQSIIKIEFYFYSNTNYIFDSFVDCNIEYVTYYMTHDFPSSKTFLTWMQFFYHVYPKILWLKKSTVAFI